MEKHPDFIITQTTSTFGENSIPLVGMVYALYGMDSDGIPTLMFYSNRKDMAEFQADRPGVYNIMRLDGISYDDFEIA